VFSIALSLSSTTRAAVSFGQIDDFQDGTVMGWVEGAISPNPPINIPSGGAGGASDAYLQNSSSGGVGAGSKITYYNHTQWIGDYVTAGVTRIDTMMANPGATDLHMRVSIQGGTFGTIFSSTNAVFLPAGADWQPVTFELTAAGLSLFGGADSLASVMGSVTDFRMLSAAGGPAHQGDTIAATVEMDNLRALRLPGDANFDGDVDSDDFNALATSFGIASGMVWQNGDFNFDGAVNSDDFNILATNFGLGVGATVADAQDWSALAAAIPEPSVLLPLAGVAVVSRRRR
jgi:hypothetical protein